MYGRFRFDNKVGSVDTHADITTSPPSTHLGMPLKGRKDPPAPLAVHRVLGHAPQVEEGLDRLGPQDVVGVARLDVEVELRVRLGVGVRGREVGDFGRQPRGGGVVEGEARGHEVLGHGEVAPVVLWFWG